jgi:predicted outer membrane protein
MRFTTLTSAAALAALCCASLSAQERAIEPRSPAEPRGAAHQVQGNHDHMIANCLAISNQEEIALAKLAAEHSANPKVKQLAETMIKDHQNALSQLKQFGAESVALRAPSLPAGARAATPRNEIAREEQALREDRLRTDAQRNTTQRTAAHENAGLDFLAIKREMADKCLQSAQREWSEKKGNDADKCFVGTQIVLHQQMLDGQEVLKRHSSPELQAVIDKSIAATQQHLTHAKDLMKELERTPAAATN